MRSASALEPTSKHFVAKLGTLDPEVEERFQRWAAASCEEHALRRHGGRLRGSVRSQELREDGETIPIPPADTRLALEAAVWKTRSRLAVSLGRRRVQSRSRPTEPRPARGSCGRRKIGRRRMRRGGACGHGGHQRGAESKRGSARGTRGREDCRRQRPGATRSPSPRRGAPEPPFQRI